MFDKLMAAQKQAEEIKKRLDTVSVFGEVEGGAIKVTATANKAITAIEIKEDFFAGADKEELEELIHDLKEGKNMPLNEARSEGNKVISEAKNKAENLLSDVNKLIEQINQEAN